VNAVTDFLLYLQFRDGLKMNLAVILVVKRPIVTTVIQVQPHAG